MSTYTDLHNKVKESVVVNYHKGFDDDRVSFQQVKLLNPDNVYRGTFTGTMNVENTTISGGEITGVNIKDSTFSGNVKIPVPGGGVVDLVQVGRDVNQLCTDLIDHRRYTAEKFDGVRDLIDNEIAARATADGALSVAFMGLDAHVKEECRALCADLTEQDAAISSQLTAQDTAISNQLALQDAAISTVLANEISILSADVRLSVDNLDAEINKAKEELYNTIETVSSTIDISVSNLCTEISNEIAARKAAIEAESVIRAFADKELDIKINNVDISSIDRDNKLDNKLNKHIDDTYKTFKSLSSTVDDKVEHDRHYEFSRIDKNQHPGQLKDFATNILTVNVADSDVFHTFAQNDDILSVHVGKIRLRSDSGNLLPFDFVTDSDIEEKDVILAAGLENATTYSFISERQINTNKNNYSLIAEGNDLSELTIDVKPKYNAYHKVYHENGDVIGCTTNNEPTGDSSNIISGMLIFDNTVQAGQFANDSVKFNTTDLSVNNITDYRGQRRITYNGSNRFTLKAYISVDNLIGVGTIGTIYEYKDSLSGVQYDADGNVSAVVIYPTACAGAYALDNIHGFDTLLKQNVIDKADGLNYDIRLSADPSEVRTTKFEQYGQRKLYSYDAIAGSVTKGNIVPNIINQTLSSVTLDGCDQISVMNLCSADLDIVEELTASTYTLLSAVEDDKTCWRWFNATADNKKTLEIKVYELDSLNYLYVCAKANDKTVELGNWVIDKYNATLFNADSWYKNYATANDIDLTEFIPQELPGNEFDITIDQREEPAGKAIQTLTTNSDNVAVETLVIPTKKFDDIAREFKIVCNSNKDIELKLVKPDGTPAHYFLNGAPVIKLKGNKWTTLQISEVRENRFLVDDVNDHSEHRYLEALSAALSVEIDTRTAQVEYLSDAVSANTADISTLSDDLSALSSSINTISADFNDRISANTSAIIDIYDTIKGGINYKGIVRGEFYDSNDHIEPIPHISNLFYYEAAKSGETPYDTADKVLSNGFLYYFDKHEGSDNFRFTIDGVEFEVGDYVIINCTDGTDGKAIKDLTSADIYVIDAQDDDVFHLSAGNQEISGNNIFHDKQTFEAIEVATETVTELSATDISAVNAKIDNLTCDMSINVTRVEASEISATKLSADDAELLTADVAQLTATVLSATDLTNDNASISAAHIEKLSVCTLSDMYVCDRTSSMQDIMELSVGDLSDQMNALSTKIWDNHYDKTISTDIEIKYNCGSHSHTMSVDQLLIVDEVNFNTYRLTIRNGALNINLVSTYIHENN